MEHWNHLATGVVPGGGGTDLHLMQRDQVFSILVDRTELMNSARSGSEEALATLTSARLHDRPEAAVLIGGLGMGFTLRAALTAFGPETRIVVAELVPAVVAWARGPLAHIFGGCLDDPRVSVVETDVSRLIQSAPGAWDGILLDVDNGPKGLIRRSNDRLYDAWGLKRLQWAMRPRGVLGVWSGAPDRRFKARLKRSGFAVTEVRTPSNGRSGRPHVVWLAESPASAPAA